MSAPRPLCRDCLARPKAGAIRCELCGSPRLAAHPDLDALRIAHVDCDAFYASVEKRDRPAIRHQPVIVGHPGGRGVVTTACYIARRFGVRSAMPMFKALAACPDAVVIPPDMAKYKAVSAQIRDIFLTATPVIEPVSLDEAYLDLSEQHRHEGPTAASALARIAQRVEREVGITVSIGLAPNKFLAKLASDHRKPDGLFVITPRMGPGFVEELPVGRFHGIGPATAARMNALGIETGHDLRQRDEAFLRQHFGKSGTFYYWIARGIDHRPVRPDRVRKSVGAENTFMSDLFTLEAATEALRPVIEKLWRHIETAGIRGRTVTLKVKFADFTQITRARSAAQPVRSLAELEETSLALLAPIFPAPKGIRLLGVTLSSLDMGEVEEPAQMRLAV